MSNMPINKLELSSRSSKRILCQIRLKIWVEIYFYLYSTYFIPDQYLAIPHSVNRGWFERTSTNVGCNLIPVLIVEVKISYKQAIPAEGYFFIELFFMLWRRRTSNQYRASRNEIFIIFYIIECLVLQIVN